MLKLTTNTNNLIRNTRQVKIDLQELIGIDETLVCEIRYIRAAKTLKKYLEASEEPTAETAETSDKKEKEIDPKRWLYAALESWNVDADLTLENVRTFFDNNTILFNELMDEVTNSGKFMSEN